MSAYHQMGHHSQNLNVIETIASKYRGTILSPVNYDFNDIKGQINYCRDVGLEAVFDPQLYFPNSDRGLLRDWSYFPSDVDTADLGSRQWWAPVVEDLKAVSIELQPDTVCSPVYLPKMYTNEYFSLMVDVSNELECTLRNTHISVIPTLVVGLSELTSGKRLMEIASIFSRARADRVYIIFISDLAPRRELCEVNELKGAMRLVSALEASGMTTIIGYCSSEFILWKAAGATDCATGKFFNLRRFTGSRFEGPNEGGGQVPYWFEESLMAFIRESDILRLTRKDFFDTNGRGNPFCKEIVKLINAGEPWVALSWRHYLYAFADLENRIEQRNTDVKELLRDAEMRWMELDDEDILMEDPRNNGSWLRSWRRAVVETSREEEI